MAVSVGDFECECVCLCVHGVILNWMRDYCLSSYARAQTRHSAFSIFLQNIQVGSKVETPKCSVGPILRSEV